jgi:hypothetical protein
MSAASQRSALLSWLRVEQAKKVQFFFAKVCFHESALVEKYSFTASAKVTRCILSKLHFAI